LDNSKTIIQSTLIQVAGLYAVSQARPAAHADGKSNV
jgi:hypothetical protein